MRACVAVMRLRQRATWEIKGEVPRTLFGSHADMQGWTDDKARRGVEDAPLVSDIARGGGD